MISPKVFSPNENSNFKMVEDLLTPKECETLIFEEIKKTIPEPIYYQIISFINNLYLKLKKPNGQINYEKNGLKDEEIDNKFYIKINNNLIDENKSLNIKIKELEKKLKEKDIIINENESKNETLNKIINEFKNIKDKDSYIEKYLKEKEKNEEIKKAIPFDINPGENLMSVIFTSQNQDINYSMVCKNTDDFTRLEKELYRIYPQYKEVENYFIVNGIKFNRYKNLEENKIKNGNVIILTTIE